MLARDIEAVYIATPQECPCRQVVHAAQAGKQILCEKPMAISLAVTLAAYQASQERRVVRVDEFCAV